jgi:hypothetical protein
MTPEIVADLIADIGMSEGNDTDFYLKKGFRVVGVEADPRSCAALRARFSEALAADRLRIVPRAAWERSGEVVTFLAQDRHQAHEHPQPEPEARAEDQAPARRRAHANHRASVGSAPMRSITR